MRFVNLMADDVWTPADIINRTEAVVRAEFSAQSEVILNRMVSGAVLGQYTLTAEEQAQVARFAAVTLEARAAGTQALADMALLAQAMAVEAAQQRLALPVVDPETGEPAQIEADADERAEAQAVVDTATQAALDLVADRAAARQAAEAEPPDQGEPG